MENYFTTQKDHIFKNTSVLIFVFDVEHRDSEKDMNYYTQAIEALTEASTGAPDSEKPVVFCLLHKMDLLPDDAGEQVFQKKRAELEKASAGAGKGI